MVFANRWDWLLDKAVKATGQHPGWLCLDWPHIIADAHKYRHALSAEETQRLAEVQWWSQLFPGEPFPEDWKPEGDAGGKIGAASSRVPKIDLEKATYKSCWIVLREKALREGVAWETLLENYKGRLHFSAERYMKYGPAVVQFRTELLTWRDLFPDEVFVGIDPQTGAQNLRTSNAVRKDNAAEEAKKAMHPVGGDCEMADAPKEDVEMEAPPTSLFPDQDNLYHYKDEPQKRPKDPRFLDGEEMLSSHGSRQNAKHDEPASRQKLQSPQYRVQDQVQETKEEERARQEFRRQRDTARALKNHDVLDNSRRDSSVKRERDASVPDQRSRQNSPVRQKPSRDLFDDRTPRHRQEYDATDPPRGRPRTTREPSGKYVRREESPGGTIRGRGLYYRHRSRSPEAPVYPRQRRERSPLKERDMGRDEEYGRDERGYNAREPDYADTRAPRNKRHDDRVENRHEEHRDEKSDDRHKKRRDERVENRHEEHRDEKSDDRHKKGRDETVDDHHKKRRDEPRRRVEPPIQSAVLSDDREIEDTYKEDRRHGKTSGRRRFEQQDVGAELRSYGRSKDSKEAKDRRR